VTSAVEFFDAPEDLDWTRYDRASAEEWLVRASTGIQVTAAQHNAALVRLATTMDMISAPDLPGLHSGVHNLDQGGYATATYAGPIVAAQTRALPVVGFEREPTDAARAVAWKALAQYARRLATYTMATGTPPAAASTALVGVAGVVAESLVPQRGETLPLEYLVEDRGTASVARVVFDAGEAYADRLARGTAAGAITAAETAGRPLLVQLAAEYDAEIKVDKRNALLLLGGGVVVAYLARSQLKKVGAYVARGMKR